MKFGVVLLDFSEGAETCDGIRGAQLAIKLMLKLPENRDVYVSYDDVIAPEAGYVISSPRQLTEPEIDKIVKLFDKVATGEYESFERVDNDIIFIIDDQGVV